MSVGYRELFHRIFDFLDFYKVRRMFSVDLNGVRIPSVLKLSSLNLDRNSDVTFADYSFTWDWEDFGKTLGTEEDKGAGVTAPFSISSHGYYETDNGECYFLYIMNNKGELSVDFDIITGDEQFSFVFAKSGVGKFTTDGGLLLLTDTDVMNSAFSSSYISFSNTTVVSPSNTENFYTGGYSESTEAQNNPLYDILPTVNGNTSVARFHEECMNRNVKKSNVLYQFNNGESGSSHHMAVNYGDVRSQGSLDNDSFPKNAVIFQDGLLISPGDVWYSDFQYYYEFKLHIGKVNITAGTPDNHIPGDWGSDKFVKFTLNFVRNDVSESVQTIKLNYDGFGTSAYTDYLKDYFDGVFASFGLDIFAEEVVGSSYTSYDVVFRSDRYFDVLFTPDTQSDLTEDTPYISRYTSYYNFKGLIDFVFVPQNVSLFKLVFDYTTTNPIEFYYTPKRDMEVSGRIDLDMPTFGNVPSVLSYGVVNRQNVHDLTFYSTMLSANADNFPTLKVYSNYGVAFLDNVVAPTTVIGTPSVQSFDLSSQANWPLLYNDETIIPINQTLKSFGKLFVPWNVSKVTEIPPTTHIFEYIDILSDYEPFDGSQNSFLTFLQNLRTQHSGALPDDSEYSSLFYKHLLNKWCFPSNSIERYPYQFLMQGTSYADISSSVYQSTNFNGYLYNPAHFDVFIPNTSTFTNDSYLWISFPRGCNDTFNSVSRILISDYSNIQDSDLSAVRLAHIATEVIGTVSYKYYYISNATSDEVPNTEGYDFSLRNATVADINQLLDTASDVLYPNFIAKDFYTHYAQSSYYWYDTATTEEYFAAIERTTRLYLDVIYTERGTTDVNMEMFVFGDKFNFSVYILNSTFLHNVMNSTNNRIRDQFAVSVKSISLIDDSLLPTTTETCTPLYLGGSLGVTDYNYYDSETRLRAVGHVYTYKQSGSFDFRYASLRFNTPKVDIDGNTYFSPYVETIHGQPYYYDEREFYYPIRIIDTSTDTICGVYILRVSNTRACLNGYKLRPFLDAQPSYSYWNGTAGGTQFSHKGSQCAMSPDTQGNYNHVFDKTKPFGNGIRPLVFPTASQTNNTLSVSAVDVQTPINLGYYTNAFSKFMLTTGLSCPVTNMSTVFYPYNEFCETDVAEGIINQITPYFSNSVDFEFIEVPSSVSFTNDNTNYIDNTLFTSTGTHHVIQESSMLLNQKVPMSYLFLSQELSGIDVISAFFDSIPNPTSVPQENLKVEFGYIHFSQTSLPICLRSNTTTHVNTSTLKVDLIDMSVKSSSTASIMSSGCENELNVHHILHNDESNYTLQVTDTAITDSNFRQLTGQSDYSKKMSVASGKWALLSIYHPENTPNTDSTSEVDILAIPDYIELDSLDSNHCWVAPNGLPVRDNEQFGYGNAFGFAGSTQSTSDFFFTYLSTLPYAFEQVSDFVNSAFSTLPDNGNVISSGYLNFSRYYAVINNQIPEKLKSTTTYPTPTSYLILDNPQTIDTHELLYQDNSITLPTQTPETLFAQYITGTTPQLLNCTYVDSVSVGDITLATDVEDYLFYAQFGLYPLSTSTEEPGLLYKSDAFSTGHGQMYTSLSDLSIVRQHYQEWSPYIGADPQIPQGASSDDTAQFILYSSSSNSGRILSFNGNEAYLSLFIKDGDGNYTDVEDTDISHFPDLESKRLSIDRFHSGYTWDMSKTLDSTISFKTVYDYETVGSEVVEIPFGYEEGADSILTEEQTMIFYGNFIPMKATYIDAGAATPVENGGDASDEPVGTLGGGGADD